MNITTLKYVVEVDAIGSISKAAHALSIAQPNLSRAIKELESELNITIFIRRSKGVQATPEGQQFISYARSIVSQLDELETLYKSPGDDSVTAAIAVPHSSLPSIAFAQFANTFTSREHFDLTLHEANEVKAFQLLSERTVQMAVIRYQSNMEPYILNRLTQMKLQHEPIWSFTMQILLSKHHPLAKMKAIPYHLLVKYPLLIHGDYQLPAFELSQLRQGAAATTPAKHIYVHDRASQYDLLEHVEGAYMWVQPLPQEELKRYGAVLRPCLLKGVAYNDIAVYPRDTVPSAPIRYYIDLLISIVSKLGEAKIDGTSLAQLN